MDVVIQGLIESKVPAWLVLLMLGIMFLCKEGIRNFFAEKIIEKQEEIDKKREKEQHLFEESLSVKKAELQQEMQAILERQRVEFKKELQHIEYKNDYYKKVIDKRMEAYQAVEELAACFDDVVLLNIGRRYFRCCENLELSMDVCNKITNVEKYSVWLSEEVLKCIRTINREFMFFLDNTPGAKCYSDKEYRLGHACDTFGEHEKNRDDLRKIIGRDLVNLCDVESFLENKKK